MNKSIVSTIKSTSHKNKPSLSKSRKRGGRSLMSLTVGDKLCKVSLF